MDDPLDYQSPEYHCVVDGCNSNIDLDSISYFRWPKEPSRCQQWKEILGFVGTHEYASLTPIESFNRLKICSIHFDKSSFSMSGKFLVNNAVPSKALVTNIYGNIDEEVLIKTEAFWVTEHLEEQLVKDDTVKQEVPSASSISENNRTGHFEHFETNNKQRETCFRESVDCRVSSSSNSKTAATFNSSYQVECAGKFLPEMAKSSANLNMPVKKRLRFKDEDDIALLQEVVGQNPFANPEMWDKIRQNVFLLTGKDFSLKTLRDHLSLLIKLWCEKKKTSKDKSGIALLHYTGKDQLCQDIFDMMWLFKGKEKKKTRGQWANNFQVKRAENGLVKDVLIESPELIEVSLDHQYCSQLVKEKIQNEINKNEYINNNSSDFTPIASASSSKEDSLETTKVLYPVRPRKRKRNIHKQGLFYQEQYNRVRIKLKREDQALEAKKNSLEERKIAIEEKKLELSEKKLAIEEFEKKKLLDILEQQRQDIQKMVERQGRIIETLLLTNMPHDNAK